MRTGMWVGVVVVTAALGLLVLLFVRWRRLPERTALILAAVFGAAVGAGALLLTDDPEVADWVFTLGVLAALTPLHVRMLVGQPGQAS